MSQGLTWCQSALVSHRFERSICRLICWWLKVTCVLQTVHCRQKLTFFSVRLAHQGSFTRQPGLLIWVKTCSACHYLFPGHSDSMQSAVDLLYAVTKNLGTLKIESGKSSVFAPPSSICRYLFSPLHPYTHRTQRLVWVPWCDSRNRASQYQIEAASWQRRADRMRAEQQDRRWRQDASGMEKERAREEERTERPSLAEQERLSDATNLNSKTWCERSRQDKALL